MQPKPSLLAHQPMLALALRAASIGLVSTTFMMAKLVAQSGISVVEVLFWRQFTAMPILLTGLVLTGRTAILQTSRLPAHAGRAVLGMIAMALTFQASILLPLPQATTLGFTAPIFAALLGSLLFRQPVGPWRAAAVAVGFAGVWLVAQPGHEGLSLLGAACGLGGGLMVALTGFQLRELARTEHPSTVVFWFSATSTPILAVAMPFVMHGHTAMQWLLLGGIGLLGSAAQFLTSAALKYGAVTSVIVMDYTALIWSVLFGWLIWDHLPPADIWLGAPLIIAAGSIIVLVERRAPRVTPVAT